MAFSTTTVSYGIPRNEKVNKKFLSDKVLVPPFPQITSIIETHNMVRNNSSALNYRNTSGILQVGFQTTTIKQVSQ